ncbi:hypothetical protein F5878DRAFT_215173 [Lentinula raphanica]|uniref:Uncharacterized protein n=1 Tax=Lentinula raphanica TaxID=153919 RepID=A0AA38PJ38_9AGAR|nr:hypothetical protein C8R42DRAFT_721180 [Lentinula raphanica]KAJ3843892.1 hypothetical protein F5878DRAFT_215173 [Lentinula raphanica]
MNRPRPSVLAQFDPLLAETEPDYVSEEEDESDPNKENLVPDLNELSMTAFFSRTYKHEYPHPPALTKRLVDVGDTTILELDDEEKGEETALETPKRSDNVRMLPRSTPRTPLAEISLENNHRAFSLQKKVVSSPTLSSRDAVSSLTSLVDSVNLAGRSFGHIQRHITPPRITVDKSDDESDILATPAPFNLQTSTSSLQDTSKTPAVSESLLALPATSSTSKESNRLSLDLHSSFSLQLQSETSFDLLNDRISFFDAQGKGMSSFLNALDDDSDSETTRHNTPLASPSCDDDDTTPTQETRMVRNLQPEDRKSPVSPSSQLDEPSPAMDNSPSPQPSSLVFGPHIKPSDSMITPAVHRIVPSVPALRIIKRTKRYDDERTSSSASSNPSTANLNPRKKTPSPPPVTSVQSESHPIRPLSKTAKQEGPLRTAVVDHVASVVIKPASQAPRPKIGTLSGTSGPKRVLLPEPAKSSKSDAGNSSTRPRVPIPSSSIINSKSASGLSSGVSRLTGVSGIPPPVSRLPAPSGIARFGRKASAPATTESSSRGGLPTRGIPRRYPTYGS